MCIYERNDWSNDNWALVYLFYLVGAVSQSLFNEGDVLGHDIDHIRVIHELLSLSLLYERK